MLRLLMAALSASLAVGLSAQAEIPAETLSADQIMARVAANQDRSEALRKEYVYKQHIHIVTHKPNSRMMREETADYDVEPQADGIQKRLKVLTGRYWNKNKYVEFQGDPGPKVKSIDPDLMENLHNREPAPLIGTTDAELIHYLRNYLLDDKSRDGVARALFPLTLEVQKGYAFRLLGQEVEGGRRVYSVAFTPKDKQELAWEGEALIDAEEFQPVRVFTKLTGNIPLLVRTMWFDLPGFGFSVDYKRQENGVWFPSSFGTEFRVHTGPVFFFNRDVAISVSNSAFERTNVGQK